jgi:hypothetical protein
MGVLSKVETVSGERRRWYRRRRVGVDGNDVEEFS